MEVWFDPMSKRIKAIYSGCSTTSTVWADQGYEKHGAIEPWMLPMETPPPTPPQPTELRGDDGKTYVVKDGKLIAKPEPAPI